MIRDRWYAVLESREVGRRKPVGVTRLGERLVFWRGTDGAVHCLKERCAHRGAALSAGRVAGDCVACPFHGFRFDPEGRCRLIPANGRAAGVPERFRVEGYPSRDAHGFVWIWWGDHRDPLPEIPFFDDLGGGFSTATFRDHWTVHYSRAIENQLDAVHLPFVHATTIGRGGQTVVDGPLVEWPAEDHLRFWTFNRVDDGTVARGADGLDPARSPVHLDFIFPNLWQNFISPRFRVVAAFAPVDEENTVIYLRLYQRMVRVPVLSHLFNWLTQRVNRIILGQDKRVVLTQRPKKTALRMGENLIPGDRPIVEYRARREKLLDRAGRAE
jgi:phenylpropionate dioxygenase-like ring-hydroxylating dioxygenase large terminal subunit